MPVLYPSHLYIRVDRGLREGLAVAAASSGLTVSAYARRELRRLLAIVPTETGQHREAESAARKPAMG